MSLIITIDVGTMSLRSIIYDTDTGNNIFDVASSYHTIFPGQGLVEQNPQDWNKAVSYTMKQTGEYLKTNGLKAEAIAVTSQRASIIPVDSSGHNLYNTITWQDKRSLSTCDEIKQNISSKEIYQRTGLRLNPYFSMPKMVWFKEHEPDLYRKTYKFLGVQDYVAFLLTGRFVTDWTQAARTLLMNIKDYKWDQKLLQVSGIPVNKLPDLVAPGSKVGTITESLSLATGLPDNLPVILTGGDQPNAALGLNIIKNGRAEANTGTGSFVISYTDKPIFDKNERVLCSASAIPGKWIQEAGIFNTGSIYRWFKENLGAKDWGEMNKLASLANVGADGTILIPHFEGSMAPYWNPLATGLFFNLSLNTTKGDMIRAILEGIAMEIEDNLSLIEKASGKLDVVSVAGGLTNSELFNNIQANVFNKKVVRYSNPEATSLGAAMSAGVSLGIFDNYEDAFKQMSSSTLKTYSPKEDIAKKYAKLRRRKVDLYNAINNGHVYEEFAKEL